MNKKGVFCLIFVAVIVTTIMFSYRMNEDTIITYLRDDVTYSHRICYA